MSSGSAKQKAELLNAAKTLTDHGYNIYATGGSFRYLVENNVPATQVYWPSEQGMEPQVMDMLQNGKIDMVVNIPKNLTQVELENGYKVRRASVDFNIPLITNARLASAFINAFCNIPLEKIQIKSWDEYNS